MWISLPVVCYAVPTNPLPFVGAKGYSDNNNTPVTMNMSLVPRLIMENHMGTKSFNHYFYESPKIF